MTDLPIEFGAALDVEATPLLPHGAAPLARRSSRPVVAVFTAAVPAGIAQTVAVVVRAVCSRRRLMLVMDVFVSPSAAALSHQRTPIGPRRRSSCRRRSTDRRRTPGHVDEILFVGRHYHGLLVNVFASVTEDLIADLADVLKRGRRSGRVEDEDVGGRLP